MNNLSPLNITRIKSVTNESGDAYMNILDDVMTLHYPDKQEKNITEIKTDESVAIFQKIDNILYFTHLLIPISDNLVVANDGRENYRFGRSVRVIAATGVANKIKLKETLFSGVDLRNRAWGRTEKISDIVPHDEMLKYQTDIWNRFSPFFSNSLNIENDNFKNYLSEIQRDNPLNQQSTREISAVEGDRILLANHYGRERNSKLVEARKSLARLDNKLNCECCNFSFTDFYGQDYIECHHNIPISQGKRTTIIEDLSLVCSNCHRMLHRKINNKYLTVNELSKILNHQIPC